MKVKTISRKMSFGNYENIEMTAEVENGETVKEALGKLENEMEKIIEEKDSFKKTVNRLISDGVAAESRLRSLNDEIENRTQRLVKIDDFMKKHNISWSFEEELPF